MKRIFVLVILVLLGWLAYLGVQKVLKSFEPIHPHPTDPAETTGWFFQALSHSDYQQCYGLLVSELKTATLARLQSRKEGYFPHFERIKEYLEKYAGPDFSADMEVSTNGRRVEFANMVVLTMQLQSTRTSDKKSHYGIRKIREFPIDAAPRLGTEKYYRGLNRAIESVGGLAGEGEIDDISEVIRTIPGESKQEAQRRMIDAFTRAPQLDTRHGILEWIIRQFRTESIAQRFLAELADDEQQPLHLRNLARQTLESTPTRR